MNETTPELDPLLTLKFEPPLEEPDRQVWKTLGYAPDVDFPKFDSKGRVKLLKDIKLALKARAKKGGGKVDLKWSGKTERRAGLLLEPNFRDETPGKKGKKEATENEINGAKSKFNLDLMVEYFEQAKKTKDKGFKASPRGVPHDYDTEKGAWTGFGTRSEPNAWLPGVFVIDEIFKALLSTVDRKIKAANKEIDEFKKNDEPGKPPALTALNKFIEDFSIQKNCPSGNPEADQYRAFINYYPEEEEPEMRTYIKLAKVDDFIVGAIVHVGDWAAGYHSSGSAIHY